MTLKDSVLDLVTTVALAGILLVTAAKTFGGEEPKRDTAPQRLERIDQKLSEIARVLTSQPDGVTVNKGK